MKKILVLFILLCPGFLSKSQVRQVEYFFDIDPGYGNGMNAGTPGTIENKPDKVYEELTLNAPVNMLNEGLHTLYVRAKNEKGWSQTQSHPFVKMNLFGNSGNSVKYVEYFFDTDPGYGEGMSVDISSGSSEYTFDPDIRSLSNGLHTMYVRVLNNENRWSQVMIYPFVKMILPSDLASGLTFAEYYIDTDPGIGNATPLPVSPDVNNLEFTADLTDITLGNHVLNVRGKNRIDQWETIGTHLFAVIASGIEDSFIAELTAYPNPVADILFIKNENYLVNGIEIKDVNGRIIMNRSVGNETAIIQLSMSEYPSGIYFITMKSSHGNKTVKIIKQ